MEVKVVEFKPIKVAVYEHRGAPELLETSVATFVKWRKETGLSPVTSSDTFGIPYSDPETTAKKFFRFDIAGTVEDDIPENPFGVKNGVISGGRYAVARHYGSHDLIRRTVYALYRDWLPKSGEQTTGEPCFFHYLNIGPDIKKSELQTDVYLPLE